MLNIVPFDAAVLEKNMFLRFPYRSLYTISSPLNKVIHDTRDIMLTKLNLLGEYRIYFNLFPVH